MGTDLGFSPELRRGDGRRCHWFALLILAACDLSGEAAGQDACGEAQRALQRCGASLGVLETDGCTGPSRLAAECVLAHDDGCDSLGGLRWDDCLADLGDTDALGPLPLEGLAVPSPTSDTSAPEEREDTDDTCSDGRDNDGDGWADCLDVDCSQDPAIGVCERTSP
jgi:hypothetical protein